MPVTDIILCVATIFIAIGTILYAFISCKIKNIMRKQAKAIELQTSVLRAQAEQIKNQNKVIARQNDLIGTQVLVIAMQAKSGGLGRLQEREKAFLENEVKKRMDILESSQPGR